MSEEELKWTYLAVPEPPRLLIDADGHVFLRDEDVERIAQRVIELLRGWGLDRVMRHD